MRKAIVLMVDEDDMDALHAGMTLDISEPGARVEAEAALTPGQTLNLIQPEDPSRSLRCMVVWAGNASSDGHDQVGLEFLDPLPADRES